MDLRIESCRSEEAPISDQAAITKHICLFCDKTIHIDPLATS
jgi:hypothetical protein